MKSKYMTVGDLIEELEKLPSDMPVAINESRNEATGMASAVEVINGEDDEHCPYDKGDDIYALGEKYGGVAPDTKVCFIRT